MKHIGSTFESWLEEEGILEEVTKVAMVKKITVSIKPERKFPVEPFQDYQKSKTWKVLDRAIEDLVENQDLVETNVRKFIIGYLMKRLTEQGLLKETAKQ